MASNDTPKKVLTKQDITKLGFLSMFLQASFNYERMQASGFLVSQLPILKKIYKDDKQGLSEAMKDNIEFINTHPNLVGFLMGLLSSLEENKEDRTIIKGLKVALFGPLAGIGDAIFWFTILPILAGVCSSMALNNNVLGPIIFFVFYLCVYLLRVPLTHLGYNLGTKAISQIKEASSTIGKAATVLGCTVIGGLIASYVKISVLPSVYVNEVSTVSIQADFFDKIFPNILPFGYVFLLYYLLVKKKVSPVVLIVSTFILSIVLSFFKIL
jgi:PTS system galactosamine-specific IID component